jgi:hypothetical protein
MLGPLRSGGALRSGERSGARRERRSPTLIIEPTAEGGDEAGFKLPFTFTEKGVKLLLARLGAGGSKSKRLAGWSPA